MTSTVAAETSEIDHIQCSEQYRWKTFDSLPNFPSLTRRQLALAGFIYRQSECVCSQCGVTIDLKYIDDNAEYAPSYFRKLHRKKVVHLGKRCAFLLCESGTNIDDLHTPLSSKQQPQWDDAEEPEYINYGKRLDSFEAWPEAQNPLPGAQQTFVTPQAMAKHGFFFSGPKDGVTCFYCGNTLLDWSKAMASTNENIVQLEHARFFPCRFVTYTAGGKFVANAGYFHTVSPQESRERNPITYKLPKTPETNETKPRTLDECLASFADWPRYAPVSAQALAYAGFYYLGEELRVKCFMCELEVDDWRHGMSALGTHRRRKNDCEVVRALGSIKTGDIQSVNEKWRLETLQGLSLFESSSSEANRRLCRELAAGGFYRFKNTRTIRCAYCGVTIEPKLGPSIMSQHRHLTKQAIKKTTAEQSHAVDCLMVRAQCPANIAIPHRERFPEHPAYQSIFDRIQSFESQKHRAGDSPVREMAEAGLFLDEYKRIRCFQCGNSLILNSKIRREKYPQYNIAQLHAHFYPTCEWVKEILGLKYIAQVLHDRYKSDEVQTPSALATPAVTDLAAPSFSHPPDEPIISDVSDEESDDEGFEPVALPPTTQVINSHVSLRSPSTPALNHESSVTTTTAGAETCFDPIVSGHTQLTSPIMAAQINPFEQLVRQQQQHHQGNEQINEIISANNPSEDHSPPLSSPPPPPVSSPVDIRSLLAHESNRLETFRKQHRETFGQVSVSHLAYVGFYLNGEGTRIVCPWCDVQLTEPYFEDIMRARPSVTRSSISEEPWTPMRVHRHANGMLMDQNHPWCTWVRRETGGLYANVTMLESQMLYPEYPLYAHIERRIRSFAADWPYPSGSRLSNQMMAEAGFFNMGGGNVCCFYCGNKLQNFEPRDCPFEEHAIFYPLCDFIQKVRGLDYVNRITLECGRTAQGRLKYEIDGAQRIKRIVFDKSGATKRKSERPPVNRINSTSTRAVPDLEIDDENACLICREKPATYEYTPCQHMPMCGECYAGLDPGQHQKCMLCFKPAKISMRVPSTPLIQ